MHMAIEEKKEAKKRWGISGLQIDREAQKKAKKETAKAKASATSDAEIE